MFLAGRTLMLGGIYDMQVVYLYLIVAMYIIRVLDGCVLDSGFDLTGGVGFSTPCVLIGGSAG